MWGSLAVQAHHPLRPTRPTAEECLIAKAAAWSMPVAAVDPHWEVGCLFTPVEASRPKGLGVVRHRRTHLDAQLLVMAQRRKREVG